MTINIVPDTNNAVVLPTSYTFEVFSGVPINLTAFGITAPDTAPFLASNIITATTTVSFSAGTYNFNINIIQIPASYPLTLKAQEGQQYNLSTFVGLDSKIDARLFCATSFVSNDNNALPTAFPWSVGAVGQSGNAIYMGYLLPPATNGAPQTGSVLVANVNVVNILPITTTEIVTRVGDKFKLQQYFTPHHNDTILVSAGDGTMNTSGATVISSEPDGTVTINGTLTQIVANFVILGVPETLTFPSLSPYS